MKYVIRGLHGGEIELWSSGLLHHVVQWSETHVFGGHTASIFTVELCDQQNVLTALLPIQRDS